MARTKVDEEQRMAALRALADTGNGARAPVVDGEDGEEALVKPMCTLEDARAAGRLLGLHEAERRGLDSKEDVADRIARAEKYAEWRWKETGRLPF